MLRMINDVELVSKTEKTIIKKERLEKFGKRRTTKGVGLRVVPRSTRIGISNHYLPFYHL